MNSLEEYLFRAKSVLRLRKTHSRARKATKDGLTDLPFGPCSINLMMVDACNSQCIMCGDDYKNCGSGDYITMAKIKTAYRHLMLSEVVDVIYGGGGEPFLNPELADIAEYTHRLDQVIQHTVITNMIKTDIRTYERLLLNHVHFLVSVNAASKETYQQISGVNAFEKVISNIQSLVSIRLKCKSKAKISMSMILMKKNIGELVDFIRLAKSLHVDKVKTLYVRVYPETYRGKNGRNDRIEENDSLFYHQKQSDQNVTIAKQTAQELGIGFEHEPLFFKSYQTVRKCTEPWKSVFINTNGDVYPCAGSEILFKKKVDTNTYNCGNLLKQSIDEFWNNRFWQALRRTNLLKSYIDTVPECSCCGNSINWCGSDNKNSHLMDWTEAENSRLTL